MNTDTKNLLDAGEGADLLFVAKTTFFGMSRKHANFPRPIRSNPLRWDRAELLRWDKWYKEHFRTRAYPFRQLKVDGPAFVVPCDMGKNQYKDDSRYLDVTRRVGDLFLKNDHTEWCKDAVFHVETDGKNVTIRRVK